MEANYSHKQKRTILYWCRRINNVGYLTIIVVFLLLTITWMQLGHLSDVPTGRYWRNIIIIPTLILLLINISGDLILRVEKININVKMYYTLFAIVAFCVALNISLKSLVVFLVSFCIPIFVSTMFSNSRLTRYVFLACLTALALCTYYLDNYAARYLGIWLIPEAVTAGGILIASYYFAQVLMKYNKNQLSDLQISFEQQQLLSKLVHYDGLTKVFNRTSFDEAVKNQIELSKKYNTKLCLAMLDLDSFKNINDTYGHVKGDLVLIKLGEILLDATTNNLSVYRFGGEEFTILFNDYLLKDAMKVCGDLKSKMSTHVFSQINNVRVTFSCGIAEYIDDMTPVEFVDTADIALYKAKKSGGNRVKAYRKGE